MWLCPVALTLSRLFLTLKKTLGSFPAHGLSWLKKLLPLHQLLPVCSEQDLRGTSRREAVCVQV